MVNNVAFCILVVCQMIWKLDSLILDVEAAFLNGELEEEIYMECPVGLTHKPTQALLLKKSIYGLVQAAIQFFKKYTTILQSIGFTQSYTEPCLFVKKDSNGIVLIVVQVDDCYIVGNPSA